jgi:hypothetical protein
MKHHADNQLILKGTRESKPAVDAVDKPICDEHELSV